MEAFRGLWGVQLLGVLVRDGHEAELVVPELVVLSINMEQLEGGLLLPHRVPGWSGRVQVNRRCFTRSTTGARRTPQPGPHSPSPPLLLPLPSSAAPFPRGYGAASVDERPGSGAATNLGRGGVNFLLGDD